MLIAFSKYSTLCSPKTASFQYRRNFKKSKELQWMRDRSGVILPHVDKKYCMLNSLKDKV